ncbi:MAG: alanyl-tRNA editing protein [Anaerolineae bacterium]|nr:alanyl-tRNA editing protein [Anaerolineae bacterium]
MQRLYYNDPYTTSFEANLIEQATYNGQPAVVLDHTYFYPTSGGQPHDTGLLNDIPVVDVVVRPGDEAVLHVLNAAPTLPAGQPVHGQIDWDRRFDYMRHHTGQHILSQAFIQVANAETIGFHMSQDSITIDLDTPALKPAKIDAAEDLANRIIADNRPVRTWFPAESELADLSLRKVPEVGGKLRVVDIDGFDMNACGGTHVAHTGEIGMIKVLRVEKRGDSLRVEFRCGARALLDYREKNVLVHQLAAELTTGYWEIPAALNKLRDENKALRKELGALQSVLLAHEADRLWQSAAHLDRPDGYTLVIQAFEDRDVSEVRTIAQKLIEHPATIALCGAAGEKAHLIAACSDDVGQDMVAALKRGLAVWGIEQGGGRPTFAQGGGVAASVEEVQAALEAAAAHVTR